MTGIQLVADYRTGLNSLDETVQSIARTRTESLSESLWSYDVNQLEQQLDSIASIPAVNGVAVVNAGDLNREIRGQPSKRIQNYQFALVRRAKSQDFPVGTLTLQIGLDGLHHSLVQKGLLVLLTNAVKSLLVGIFILFIYQWLIGRHLDHISAFAVSGRDAHDGLSLPRLALDRKPSGHTDELIVLQSTLNDWLASIEDKSQQLAQARDQIEEHRNALSRANEHLERTNHELSHFAYSASHDLKSPLNAIIGMLAFSEQDVANGNTDEALTTIAFAKNQAEVLADRIEDMLVLAKSDRDHDDIRSVRVQDVVRNVWEQSQAQYPNQRAVLTEAYTLDDCVDVPETRFKIVLENLMSNAFKYASPDRDPLTVHITSSSSGETLTLSIQDNGIGIPAEYHARVFGMFERFADTQQPGSGLGLAIVQKNINRMDGQITFHSSPTGTTFDVTIPLPPAMQH